MCKCVLLFFVKRKYLIGLLRLFFYTSSLQVTASIASNLIQRCITIGTYHWDAPVDLNRKFYGDVLLIPDHKAFMMLGSKQALLSTDPLTSAWRSRRWGEPGRPSWVAGLGPSSSGCSSFTSCGGWSLRKRPRSAVPSSRTSTGWVAIQSAVFLRVAVSEVFFVVVFRY